MTITRRQWMLGAAAGEAAGCGRGRHRSQADTITVLNDQSELSALGPDGTPAQYLVFLPLVAWNHRNELEGRLAESWDHSPDYRTWTVRLRDGIRWHDGVPVTAHDVKSTIDLFEHPDVLAFAPGSLDVEVIDDLTYGLTCHNQVLWGTPMDDVTVYYPKHLIEKMDPKQFWNWDFWTRPIGNGPYRHARTVPQTMMHFQASSDYYRGRPKIGNVVLKFGDSVLELLSGDVDASANLKRADLLTLARDGRFQVYHQPSDTMAIAMLWNHRHPLFRDAYVRRALTLAINRRELFQTLNIPSDTPVIDAPTSKRQFRRRQVPAPIPHDLAQSNHLLDQAGWLRNQQGLRERDGTPFRFTVITDRSNDQDAAAVYIQSQLKRIGIRMDIQLFESVFARAVTGDYEAAINRFFTDWKPGNGPENFLAAAGYTNPRFSQLADLLKAPLAPEQEDSAYRDLAQLFQRDVPATFLYPRVLTTVAHRRIRGLENAAYPGDLTWCLDQLSLAEEEA